MKENLLLRYLKPGADVAVETAMGRTFGKFEKVEDGCLLLKNPWAIIRLGAIRGIEFHSEDAPSLPNGPDGKKRGR